MGRCGASVGRARLGKTARPQRVLDAMRHTGGTLLATAALALTTALTSNDTFIAWAWRIPFLVSVVLILYGVWLRARVPETPQFSILKAKDDIARAPVMEVLGSH